MADHKLPRVRREPKGACLVAADYPLLDVFWTMLIFFAWIAWFIILFRVLADVFRRHDIGGGAKTLWIIFVIFCPSLGCSCT